MTSFWIKQITNLTLNRSEFNYKDENQKIWQCRAMEVAPNLPKTNHFARLFAPHIIQTSEVEPYTSHYSNTVVTHPHIHLLNNCPGTEILRVFSAGDWYKPTDKQLKAVGAWFELHFLSVERTVCIVIDLIKVRTHKLLNCIYSLAKYHSFLSRYFFCQDTNPTKLS